MALVIIMKKTGTHSVFDVNAFEIMFTYLCLEKNQREHVVGLMDKSLRSVIICCVQIRMYVSAISA